MNYDDIVIIVLTMYEALRVRADIAFVSHACFHCVMCQCSYRCPQMSFCLSYYVVILEYHMSKSAVFLCKCAIYFIQQLN